jgi:hypothetical protein
MPPEADAGTPFRLDVTPRHVADVRALLERNTPRSLRLPVPDRAWSDEGVMVVIAKDRGTVFIVSGPAQLSEFHGPAGAVVTDAAWGGAGSMCLIASGLFCLDGGEWRELPEISVRNIVGARNAILAHGHAGVHVMPNGKKSFVQASRSGSTEAAIISDDGEVVVLERFEGKLGVSARHAVHDPSHEWMGIVAENGQVAVALQDGMDLSVQFLSPGAAPSTIHDVGPLGPVSAWAPGQVLLASGRDVVLVETGRETTVFKDRLPSGKPAVLAVARTGDVLTLLLRDGEVLVFE